MGTSLAVRALVLVPGTPVRTPAAIVTGIRVVIAVRIPALYVGEIIQDLSIGTTKGPDLLVPDMEVTIRPGPIRMAGHVNKCDIWIVRFQPCHSLEIDVYPFFRVIRNATTP